MAEEKKVSKDRGKWFREMRSELKKVVWPDGKTTAKNTGTVLLCSLIVGAAIWIFDAVAVLAVDTTMHLTDILHKTQEIEKKMGSAVHRKRDGGYADRIIDIDLLASDGEIICNSELTLPHPRMHERLFVMVPFVSVAPGWIHPVFHKTAKDLLSELKRSVLSDKKK